MRRWKCDTSSGNRHDIEVVLRVSHLSVSNDQKTSILITKEIISQFEKFWQEHYANTFVARDLIVSSICPQVCESKGSPRQKFMPQAVFLEFNFSKFYFPLCFTKISRKLFRNYPNLPVFKIP